MDLGHLKDHVTELEALPIELKIKIFNFLDVCACHAARGTCQEWNLLIWQETKRLTLISPFRSHNTAEDEQTLRRLLAKCKRLQYLDLSRCFEALTDDVLHYGLALASPLLRKLSLQHWSFFLNPILKIF